MSFIKTVRNWFLKREEEARYIQRFRNWLEKEGYTKKTGLDIRTTRVQQKKEGIERRLDRLMRQDVIDQLRREGLAGAWRAEAGERAGYKCEYCDKDMLASVDNYLSWQLDHIVPESAGGDHTLENMALSCRECKVRFKGDWNPAYVAGEDASREELILVVRENVRKKRSSWDRCLSRSREIVGWEESESNRKDD